MAGAERGDRSHRGSNTPRGATGFVDKSVNEPDEESWPSNRSEAVDNTGEINGDLIGMT